MGESNRKIQLLHPEISSAWSCCILITSTTLVEWHQFPAGLDNYVEGGSGGAIQPFIVAFIEFRYSYLRSFADAYIQPFTVALIEFRGVVFDRLSVRGLWSFTMLSIALSLALPLALSLVLSLALPQAILCCRWLCRWRCRLRSRGQS